jgi:hypothetical protein
VVCTLITGMSAVDRPSAINGKDPAWLQRELMLRTSIEPLLRRSVCLEIDTFAYPMPDVTTMIMNHVQRGQLSRDRTRDNAPRGE